MNVPERGLRRLHLSLRINTQIVVSGGRQDTVHSQWKVACAPADNASLCPVRSPNQTQWSNQTKGTEAEGKLVRRSVGLGEDK